MRSVCTGLPPAAAVAAHAAWDAAATTRSGWQAASEQEARVPTISDESLRQILVSCLTGTPDIYEVRSAQLPAERLFLP